MPSVSLCNLKMGQTGLLSRSQGSASITSRANWRGWMAHPRTTRLERSSIGLAFSADRHVVQRSSSVAAATPAVGRLVRLTLYGGGRTRAHAEKLARPKTNVGQYHARDNHGCATRLVENASLLLRLAILARDECCIKSQPWPKRMAILRLPASHPAST